MVVSIKLGVTLRLGAPQTSCFLYDEPRTGWQGPAPREAPTGPPAGRLVMPLRPLRPKPIDLGALSLQGRNKQWSRSISILWEVNPTHLTKKDWFMQIEELTNKHWWIDLKKAAEKWGSNQENRFTPTKMKVFTGWYIPNKKMCRTVTSCFLKFSAKHRVCLENVGFHSGTAFGGPVKNHWFNRPRRNPEAPSVFGRVLVRCSMGDHRK